MKFKFTRKTNNIPKMKAAAEKVANSVTMKAGWISGLKYDDNTFVAAVAQQNEFGVPSKHIPPRPFMRPTASEHKEEWKNTIAKLIKKQDIATVFEKLGLVVAGQIKAKIASIWEPPLSQVTVNARLAKYDNQTPPDKSIYKPLVDTGTMLAAVSYEVTKGGK